MASTVEVQIDESAIDAIDSAAGYCRTLWVTFIGYAATMFVLASGTTHDDLLRQTPVKLPLFDVDSGIPLTLFYVIAPLLLVLFHLNLLLKLHDLRVRVRAVIAPAKTMTAEEADEFRARLRRTFTSFDYALLESGLVERREGLLLRAVVGTTIFIMPIVLLLFVQLQFLPYHDWKISWVHRALLAADLALIAVIQLWLGLDESQTMRRWNRWRPKSISAAVRSGTLAFSFAVPVFVSIFVLAFPGERQDVFWRAAWSLSQPPAEEFDVPEVFSALAGADFAESFGIRRSLYLADRTLWAEEPAEDLLQALTEDVTIITLGETVPDASPELLRTVQRIHGIALNLRGRNLAYANFENSTLIAADLRPDLNNEQMRAFQRDTGTEGRPGAGAQPARRTDLTGTSFSGADLRAARLSYAEASRADFYTARVQNAAFDSANVSGANFQLSRAQMAKFTGALLAGANLSDAELHNADFAFAGLAGANLSGAQLFGTTFIGAQLAGADLSNAKLPEARFYEAQLQGADLSDAAMPGADFNEAQLQGALFNRAQLIGANFESAQLQGADFSAAQANGANFTSAGLQAANFDSASLRAADFSRAAVRGADFSNADISLANLAGLNAGQGYEFEGWDAYETALGDEARRGVFHQTAISARERAKAPGPDLARSHGDSVWATDPELFGDRMRLADASDPRAYAMEWARLLSELACRPGEESEIEGGFAAAGVARRLAARAKSLAPERDPSLRLFGTAIAQAQVAQGCARSGLSDEVVAELEAIAARAPDRPR